MMSDSECQYCNKIFSNKHILKQHQKTAKYCLEKQGGKSVFICEYCDKSLSTNDRLHTHHVVCKEKQKLEASKDARSENEKLKETIKLLEEKLNDIETRCKEKLKDKNEYISKLEIKLQKFENAVIKSNNNDQTTSPIPLKEQINSIIIDELKDDDTVNCSIITLNNVNITSRPIDHYVNATELCQAGNKKFNHWYSLDNTKELINVLESDTGIPASLLVESKRGQSMSFEQGSWIHPDLAIQLAQWISPQFAIQVAKWVRTLYSTGSVEIDLSLIRKKDERIKKLESVCLSKQSRVEYPGKNVIYLLTTEEHLKNRTYIVGKAKNLTTRLGTYNKTCDHTVVYYKECKGEEDMDLGETMVIAKLKDYKEKANRDRFILPEDKDVSFFIDIIAECIKFL